MTRIERNPENFASDHYDVLVIGGGIYGACTLLEASRRGLRALLLERDDFGGATSWNSLRIIHGGLRYLQTGDLRRFRRSVREQAWWLQHFPDCVQPLPCLMPLYEQGLRRTGVMRAALRANDAMAAWVRKPFGVQLDSGKVISAEETKNCFPFVKANSLRSGAVWYDAMMNSPQRTLIEVLRWAVSAGGRALNYVGVESIATNGNRVRGVVARCGVTGKKIEYLADTVINCTGPWVRELLPNSGRNRRNTPQGEVGSGELWSQKKMARAYNVCVNRPLVGDHAVAVTSDQGNTYFCVPLQQGAQTLIGTVHLPPSESAEPTEGELSMFVNDFRTAVPRYGLLQKEIVSVLWGRLPPQANGSHLPRKSPKIVSGKDIAGLVSIEGVKYTTARRIAEKALFSARRQTSHSLPPHRNTKRPAPAILSPLNKEISASDLRNWIRQESVVHLDDLLFRRADSRFGTSELQQLAKKILPATDWNEAKCRDELMRISNKLTNGVANTPQDV